MNQLQTNDQVKNLIQIRKSLKRGKAGNLAENQAFLDFLAIQQQMTAEVDKTWEVIKERMIEHDVKKIYGPWGHVLIGTRGTFKKTGRVTPSFMKKTLDTAKVGEYFKLYKKVPAGITLTHSKYLEKKIKLAA